MGRTATARQRPAPRRQIQPASVIQWTGTNLEEVTTFASRLFRAAQNPDDPAVTGEIYDWRQEARLPVKTGEWIIDHGYAKFEVLDDDAFRAAYELPES